MAKTVKKKKQSFEFVDDSDRWESRELGVDENLVRVSDQGTEARVDEGLGKCCKIPLRDHIFAPNCLEKTSCTGSPR